MKHFALTSLALFSLFLCACAPVLVAGGAVTGVAASQEGGLSGAWDDTKIQMQINDLWFRYNVDTFAKLDLTVSQGRVLITGVVQDPEHRVEAVRLAWQPDGVRQVINEIRVAESKGISGYVKDVWITTRLRTAITLDKKVTSLNYSIDTVQGVVYLMGFAQNQAELDHVTSIARRIKGVNQVVSYVKVMGSKDRGSAPSAPSGQEEIEWE